MVKTLGEWIEVGQGYASPMGQSTGMEAAEKTVQDPGPRTAADDRQIGGSHYKDMDVQPWEVMAAVLSREEFIGFLKGNIIKYAMRQGRKDSPDAGKCQHYIQKLNEVLEQS
jgi:hypothetical protein